MALLRVSNSGAKIKAPVATFPMRALVCRTDGPHWHLHCLGRSCFKKLPLHGVIARVPSLLVFGVAVHAGRRRAATCKGADSRQAGRTRIILRAQGRGAEQITENVGDLPELEAMRAELRGLKETASSDEAEESGVSFPGDDAESMDEEEPLDVSKVERSGRVCVLGVPNSGKSSLVNALVGTKVSIVSPKPQTTRQRILGLALLSARPGEPPDTQAVFVDTAGIMMLDPDPVKLGGYYRKESYFKGLKKTRLHKAMVKTAWKATRGVDAIFWVLDALKCCGYGDYMPEVATLDGIPVGPPIRDAWWQHPELGEELGFLRTLRKRKFKVNVVLNKIDRLRDYEVDVGQFALVMRQQLLKDLGNDEGGQPLLQNLWPTSVLKEPDTLLPVKMWLCQNLPQQSPLYPVQAVSDVPARVIASEITREKLFARLTGRTPYSVAVLNRVWRETPDGTLLLGQKIVTCSDHECGMVRRMLKDVTQEAEAEISTSLNFGRPVQLHFNVLVDETWQDNESYYIDVHGILDDSGSLIFPQ